MFLNGVWTMESGVTHSARYFAENISVSFAMINVAFHQKSTSY